MQWLARSGLVSTHSHPKVAGSERDKKVRVRRVSTHSHPKVAGSARQANTPAKSFQHTATRRWLDAPLRCDIAACQFQHTATRRWLGSKEVLMEKLFSRFNTQPPEGGWPTCSGSSSNWPVSTHSHPKVAGAHFSGFSLVCWFQHTATRRWLVSFNLVMKGHIMFQHTATRRWLGFGVDDDAVRAVSTHSHPKVAGGCRRRPVSRWGCFNTQPPEGGWGLQYLTLRTLDAVSTHSHPKVAGSIKPPTQRGKHVSTHSHPKVAGAVQQLGDIGLLVSTHSHPKVAG